ncbi:MAG: hypothetical protein JKY48_04220 [Flavobacteriales bacterium]|nr:hypothetical protein [Flavobacteriales bacterium]
MKQLLIPFLILSLSSCKSDDDGDEEVAIGDARVVILNEGNFQFGNASVSVYNEDSKTIENKVFQANNSGRPVGDVVQSALQIDDRLFIVVNNSSKIEVLDAKSFKSIGSIQNLNSPRYICLINNEKAYVSDFYEDKVYVINPQTLSIINTIETKGWVEEMVLVNNKVFACHVDSNQVWVIDTSTDQVIEKINTHIQPQYIEADVNGNVWVSCTGGFAGDPSAFYLIDGKADSVLKVLEEVNSSLSIEEFDLDRSGERIFYISSGGLYETHIDSSSLPTIAKIPANNRTFYGVSVDLTTDEIYICDAIDYQQKGVIYRYDQSFNQLDAFKVGIIPGDVYFLK